VRNKCSNVHKSLAQCLTHKHGARYGRNIDALSLPHQVYLVRVTRRATAVAVEVVTSAAIITGNFQHFTTSRKQTKYTPELLSSWCQPVRCVLSLFTFYK
jgi:hypothetical protein